MEKLIYFDNAATTFPKPASVVQKLDGTVRMYCANPGRSSHRLSIRAAEEVYSCREKLAGFFGGSDDGVVFTSSATHSINLALKSVLRRGDHVLISDIEHNAVLRPIAALAKKGFISYDIYTSYENPEKQIAEISARIKPRTAVICACHHSNICNLTLTVSDIGRLCRKNGIIFFVDASQSAGIIPIDIERENIDILCAPGHKGLYGIPGCGFALFGKRLNNGKLLSTFIEGGNGVSSENMFMPDFLPERLEAGTLPLPAIASLSAGLDYVKKLTPDKIRMHEQTLCRALRQGLSRFEQIRIYSENDGSILLFSASGMTSEEFAGRLDDYGICVRAGLHCAPLAHRKLGTPTDGAVRVSFGAQNTLGETERFIRACHNILSGR